MLTNRAALLFLLLGSPADEHDDDIEGVLSGAEPPDVWRRRRELRAG